MPRYINYVPVRMGSRLLDKVNDYIEAEGIKDKSKAIRALIEIGLSLPPRTLHNGGAFPEKIDAICPMTSEKLDSEQCKQCETKTHNVWVKCHS